MEQQITLPLFQWIFESWTAAYQTECRRHEHVIGGAMSCLRSRGRAGRARDLAVWLPCGAVLDGPIRRLAAQLDQNDSHP